MRDGTQSTKPPCSGAFGEVGSLLFCIHYAVAILQRCNIIMLDGKLKKKKNLYQKVEIHRTLLRKGARLKELRSLAKKQRKKETIFHESFPPNGNGHLLDSRLERLALIDNEKRFPPSCCCVRVLLDGRSEKHEPVSCFFERTR